MGIFGLGQRKRISVVADGASAKSFLLEREAFIEHLPAVLGGNAEVEETETLLAVTLNEVVEEQVECAHFAPCGTGGNVLRMHNGIHFEEKRPRHEAATLTNGEKAYVGRVVVDESAQFINRMHWGYLMARSQGFVKDLPKCRQVVGCCIVHNVTTLALRSLHLSASQRGESHACFLQGHGLGGSTRCEPSAQSAHPIEFFFRGQRSVDVRDRFDDKRFSPLLLVIGYGFSKHFAHLHKADARGQHTATVGQACVGNDGLGQSWMPTSGEKSHRSPMLVQPQQRSILKPLAMVVHIAAVEQKRPIAAFVNGAVPQCAMFGRVGENHGGRN